MSMGYPLPQFLIKELATWVPETRAVYRMELEVKFH
jgi:hypothetical protein